ncbi:ATP-binding protein [Salana multivorans]
MQTLIERHLTADGSDLLDTFPAVVVQGARQVGKSTFARMLAASRPHVEVSLDDVESRTSADLDQRTFVRQAGDGLLVIDEIQRDPSLLLTIKSEIDRDRRPGRFLLTGSSDLLRLSRTPDSLAGRAVTLNLYGLSQGELLGVRDDFASWVLTSGNLLDGASHPPWSREDYIAALTRGGYPEVQALDQRHRGRWYDSYLDRLLIRDVGDVSRGLSADRLEAVLRLVGANQGGELVQARLATELSIPKSAIAAYLAALSTLYLTSDLPPWRANLTKREIGRHKVAVADSGLAARLARLTPATLGQITSATVLGGHLEAFVVSELTKQRGWSAQEFDLFHFRDRDGLEVDVVIEFGDGRVFLVEVKATATYRAEHARGIRALAERLGDRFIGGAILGLSPQRYQLAERLWALPVASLWQDAEGLG